MIVTKKKNSGVVKGKFSLLHIGPEALYFYFLQCKHSSPLKPFSELIQQSFKILIYFIHALT